MYCILLILAIALSGCGGGASDQIGRNISDIEGAEVAYEQTDNLTGDSYQIVTITTIPNVEYTITSANGKKCKVIDDVPITLCGVADMDGKIIVPIQFRSIHMISNGNIEVETSERLPELANGRFHGVYKDGKAVVEPIYHSLKMDPDSKGAMATISNPDGRTQQIYAIDFNNNYAKTLLPHTSLSAGIKDGKIHIRTNKNPEWIFKSYWFDFAGNEITE